MNGHDLMIKVITVGADKHVHRGTNNNYHY